MAELTRGVFIAILKSREVDRGLKQIRSRLEQACYEMWPLSELSRRSFKRLQVARQ